DLARFLRPAIGQRLDSCVQGKPVRLRAARGPLESRWKKSYNGDLRWVHPDFVAICSRRASMSSSSLTPERAEGAERVFQSLRQAVDSALRSLAELLASKPDRQLLGRTEFEVRDRVHKIGARAIEAALNERKKGGTEGPA